MATENQVEDTNAAARERAHWELTWGVQRSIRYHRHREQWLDRVNGWCAFATVVFGTGGVVSLLTDIHPVLPMAAAAITAVAGVLLLTFGVGARARLHSELAHDFTLLERDMVHAGENVPAHELRRFQARRLDIESREPPTLQVLNTMCHDELVNAYGIDASHRGEPRWYQRWLANIVDVGASQLNRPAPGATA